MDILSRLRRHVRIRYQGETPRQWSPSRREEYLEQRALEVQAQIEETTGKLVVHNLAQFSAEHLREPTEQERIGLVNNSRLSAIELALAELYDGFESLGSEGDPDGEPTQEERERMIGARLDAQWKALSPMQRWMTPWSEDPDEDLIGLARRLWRGHDIHTKVAAAHLLTARRMENLPIPESIEDPFLLQVHQELLDGITAEQQRQHRLRTASHQQT